MHADDPGAAGPDDAPGAPALDETPSDGSESAAGIPPTAGDPAAGGTGEAPGRSGLYWRFAMVLIALDQLTKALVRGAVPLYDSKPVIPGVLDLVHVRNEGVAFGLLNNLDLSYKWALTTALAMGALIGIAYYAKYVRHEERLARLGLSMILGGAIGNLIDRATRGYVLDFVDVYWGTWHFWAFNVADASIFVGAILVFADLLLVKPHVSSTV